MNAYNKYVQKMTDQFASDMAKIKRHEDTINRFGAAMEQLDLSISIYVYSTGSLSLTAVGSNYDHAMSMLDLLQAGYDIDEPVEESRTSKDVSYRAPVSGHGFEFTFFFTTRIA